MQTFLADVIDYLQEKSNSLSHYTFVLPSIRAGVFLKEEIKRKSKKAIVLPNIISIEEFVNELSSLSLIDNTKLLFEFYSIYLKETPQDKIESFDVFSKWATMALQDFNEIDRHLIDTNYIFSYLQDIDRIEHWEVKNETKITKNYFNFFAKLHSYYKALYSSLKERSLAYQGMLYREAVDNINLYIENANEYLVFVGFNALNAAEEKMIRQLLESDKASIFWDADTYFFEDKNTSMFFKEYQKKWDHFKQQPFNWIKNNFKQKKNINVIGCPKNNTQLKYVAEILASNQQTNFEHTALVLAEESLLPLALTSLPKEVRSINITMGYDLKNIAIAKLFNHIFKLRINAKNTQFYHQDILKILNHATIKSNFDTASLINEILKNNYTFLTYGILKKLSENKETLLPVLQIFKDLNSTDVVDAALKRCLELIEILKEHTATKLEKEFLFKLFSIFQQLTTLNNEYQYIKDLKTLHQFYLQLLNNEKLSFQGEPLSGLQLMGVLETRVLDFETVIITSVNEGILPSGKTENSFIPYDVKREVGLPTYQEKDAIFSYHFFRLLQRAKNIYLLYNTESDHYGTGEKSRFITQLEIDKPKYISKLIVSPVTQTDKSELQEINKTEDIINSLKAYAKRGISPSSLTSYMYNPILFYKQKILGIDETDEVEETVAVNTLGTIIHKTLEVLYLPLIGKILEKKDIISVKSKINDEVKKSFEIEYHNGDISTGKNLIIFNIAKQYVNNFINLELKLISEGKQIKILALEHKVETEVIIKGCNFPIKLKGEIDRIDELDGVLRIIDYKTGKVDQSKVTVVNWDELTTDYDKYSKSFQLLMYAYMLYKNNEIRLPVEAGIISFKNLGSGFLNFCTKDAPSSRNRDTLMTKETLHKFEIELQKLILELFNTKIPFLEKELKNAHY